MIFARCQSLIRCRWVRTAALLGLGALGCQGIRPSVLGVRDRGAIARPVADLPVPGAAPTKSPTSSDTGLTQANFWLEAPIPCDDENADGMHVVDLVSAFRLAGIDNPTINLARERINEALAEQTQAKVLLIPSLNAGGNYRSHLGALQSSAGFIRYPNSQSLYLGAGAGTSGTASVAIPGVWLFAQLGDAIYAPLAARQRVDVRRFDAVATENDILLRVASGYLELAGAEARAQVLRSAESNVQEIVRVTTAFAKAGQGREADANRARANAQIVRRDLREAEGSMRALSARLAALLSLDPSTRLHTPSAQVAVVRLIAEDRELDDLVSVAVRSRPELYARLAATQEALTNTRRERARPWLPLLVVGYSAAGFGGGSNLAADDFAPLQGRADVTAMAVWNLQNMGFGNCALIRRADAVAGQAREEYEVALNQVRREVGEAQAVCKAAARQVDIARVAVATAEEGFRLETERIKQGQGRPIEALDSFRQLTDSQLELIRAIVAFDMAQFRLFVALGNTPGPGGHEPAAKAGWN